MAEASDDQVQHWLERARRLSEQTRALYINLKDIRATIEDVYNAANSGKEGFVDAREDVPHKATMDDIKSFNAFAEEFNTFIEANQNYPTVVKLCVRPPLD